MSTEPEKDTAVIEAEKLNEELERRTAR